jgi:hypothetical protein
LLQCKPTIDMHRFRLHKNCKIDTARFEEGKRRRRASSWDPKKKRNTRPELTAPLRVGHIFRFEHSAGRRGLLASSSRRNDLAYRPAASRF